MWEIMGRSSFDKLRMSGLQRLRISAHGELVEP
jgi:hypothetical protein